jgi:hypothetical protein
MSFGLQRVNSAEFEVLTAVSKKTTVFWIVAPCSPVVYQTTRRYTPEDSHFRLIQLFKYTVTVGMERVFINYKSVLRDGIKITNTGGRVNQQADLSIG